MKIKKNIVIKIGTTSIIKDELLNKQLIESLAGNVKLLKSQGVNTLIVTSGAVQLGANELKLKKRPTNLKSLQVASSVGQIELINSFKSIFNNHNLKIGQVLMSKNVLEDRSQFVNTTEALNELLNQDIIPVINENDIVATEELKFGDNDRLSAIVAIITKAEKLIIVTDQEGLFNADPTSTKGAQKIDYIEFDSEELTNLIDKSSSGRGVGGFSTKIMAAQMAGFSGIPTQIIPWTKDAVLNCINEVEIGTLIKPSLKKVKLKKLWIAYGLPVTGKIIIDTGAVEAISSDASLLSIGIKEIIKNFDNDEGVEIFDDQNNLIAKGISKIDSSDISNKNNEIVIHKDNLLIL
ncbi:glutamate 5-kinase [Acidimicrobiia bacterium]|jgi:glutamate 5-kinase|nr:glutamate 5-kinase [Acidimicrobiia bacterium]MDA8922479.1 glutamate 5-kinase [Acidimicrobiia bacterium]MDA9036938.1 glutamate 5-kinase [Acidimicrobiia bacterium]MDA9862809.1 glutamate 5-kinase [Acidimicrobiia bacterium]MDB3983620.1 glutamate 5-kinase [Acidimicrobiia bacterium]|tara:strand:+ start:3642 stop:4694 length:1053 start_codon:yes stop_codon:yes gene_type:complete